MAIETLAKPAGAWCPECKPGRGCQSYENRPAECRSFNCLWLIDQRFGSHWKPTKSKLVLTASQDGIEIRCDPGFPDAWRRDQIRSEIAKLAAFGEEHDVTVLIIIGAKMMLVTPDREFDLGVVGPQQRMVRELEGRRVIGASVVKASDPDERK